MMKKINIALTISLLSALSSGANAALVSRLGGLAYYDTEADLTWLTDAEAAGTIMSWADANTWAADLNVGGNSNWRLPTADGCGVGIDCASSEMGSLFYTALGNTAGSFGETGPFSNVQEFGYWLATEYAPDTGSAWAMEVGYQAFAPKINLGNAWAVQSGDVAAVPVPAAAWLFGSALLGLVSLGKRKR